MARPRCCKHVDELPDVVYFKPRGRPLSELQEIQLGVEELEALRLAHLEGLYQQEAAERMKVSRPTFGRLLDLAHRKVAEALVRGHALRIEGGSFHTDDTCGCPRCRRASETTHQGDAP